MHRTFEKMFMFRTWEYVYEKEGLKLYLEMWENWQCAVWWELKKVENMEGINFPPNLQLQHMSGDQECCATYKNLKYV